MPEYFDSTAAFPKNTRRSIYRGGGVVKGGRGMGVALRGGGRVAAKDGDWIQKVDASIKRRGTKGVCTGKKFGSKSCPPGSKRYNLAKTFRKMAKKRKG
jgi:hypothetical protein